MKTRILLLFVLLPFLSQATVWRVNGNEGVDADFADLPEAVAGASSGDTLYVEPLANGVYSFTNVDKMLYIYGSGYLLNSNDSTQYQSIESQLDVIRFVEGSEGSLLSGFKTSGSFCPFGCGQILINACCITIENCRNSGNPNSDRFIAMTSKADNCVIRNCHYPNGDVEVQRIEDPELFGTGVSGTIISNSIFKKVQAAAITETITSLIVNNCILTNGGVSTDRARNTTFSNCIAIGTYGQYCDGSCTFINTVKGSANLNGTEFNTILIESGDALFDLSFSDHPELQYQLDPASPAKGAGTDGTDCGIFGGVEPYQLSGMPNIPSIFELSVGAIGNANNQTLDVNLKAKSHD